MIINALKLSYDKNRDQNVLFVRNVLKEHLQYYILNFIYNSLYAETFLFKGGTCLRFCFDLPRLSEDLDFDVLDFESFNVERFVADIKIYFKSKLKYEDLTVKISGSNKILYLHFPILRRIGFPVNEQKPSENILFVRIDFSAVNGKYFDKQISLTSTYNFSFIIRRYSLPDLFSGKIAALLMRETIAGENLQPRFKGRDYFDFFWFIGKQVKPNYRYLTSLTQITSKKDLLKKINKQFDEAIRRKNELKADLLPFFQDSAFVEDFMKNLIFLRKTIVERL